MMVTTMMIPPCLDFQSLCVDGAVLCEKYVMHPTGCAERLAFATAKAENRGSLGVFITAGDPDVSTTDALLDGLVEAGVDFIELGMPFSDPMADGPAIQAASLRALRGGMTLTATIEIAVAYVELVGKLGRRAAKGTRLMPEVSRISDSALWF